MADIQDHPAPQAMDVPLDPDRLAQDATIPDDLRLPPRTWREEWSGHLRNGGFFLWGVVLALMFGMPSWGWWDTAIGWLDVLLWPLFVTCGRFWGVAAMGALTALFSLLAQYVMSDIPVMREVKRRTELLRREAAKVPLRSPRDVAFTQEANKGAWRIAGFGFVAIGALLGPMLLAFLWIPIRVDHANAAPGEPVVVIARLDGAYTGPVTLDLPQGLQVTEHTDSQSTALTAPGGLRVVQWAVVSDHPGLLPVAIVAGESRAQAAVRIGNAVPPPINAVVEGNGTAETYPGQGILRAAMVVTVKDKPSFWKIGGWEVGWLWLYMAVYIPVMVLVKRGLRIP